MSQPESISPTASPSPPETAPFGLESEISSTERLQSSDSDFWATMTPSDLVGMVANRWPSVLLTTIVVTLLGIIGLLLCPNQYASEGLFYVRLGRGAVSMDPTTQPSQSVSMQESRSSEVISISEMLTSREIADRVVEQVGAREINHPRNWVEQIASSLSASAHGGSDSQNGKRLERTEYERQIAHEEAVERIQGSVGISNPKSGYTIQVAATTADPHLSQKIVQAYMDQYGAMYIKAHQASGSLDFFTEQTNKARALAVDARNSLAQARNELGWMSTELSEESLQERILGLELAFDQASSDFAESESHTKELKYQLDDVERWIATEVTSVANLAADGMKTALYEYQVSEGEKMARVTPSHPRYKILRGKIDQGEQLAGNESGEREETVESINPVYQTLQGEFQQAAAKTAGLKARVDSLTKSLETARKDLQRLHSDSTQLADLAWNAEIAERNYLEQSEKLEAARITSELDRQEMSDITVIQNASLNLKKVGPKRGILAVLAGFGGFALGITQSLVRTPKRSRFSKGKRRGSGRVTPVSTVPIDHAVRVAEPRRVKESAMDDFAGNESWQTDHSPDTMNPADSMNPAGTRNPADATNPADTSGPFGTAVATRPTARRASVMSLSKDSTDHEFSPPIPR